jgi:hypothetical protein
MHWCCSRYDRHTCYTIMTVDSSTLLKQCLLQSAFYLLLTAVEAD